MEAHAWDKGQAVFHHNFPFASDEILLSHPSYSLGFEIINVLGLS
jgi:hypothetical protein